MVSGFLIWFSSPVPKGSSIISFGACHLNVVSAFGRDLITMFIGLIGIPSQMVLEACGVQIDAEVRLILFPVYRKRLSSARGSSRLNRICV